MDQLTASLWAVSDNFCNFTLSMWDVINYSGNKDVTIVPSGRDILLSYKANPARIETFDTVGTNKCTRSRKPD